MGEVWHLQIYLLVVGKMGGEALSQQFTSLQNVLQDFCHWVGKHRPVPTEGRRRVSAEHVLSAWDQPYLVFSPGSSAGFTYLMKFYGFSHCKLYSLSQTSKTFLHLLSLTCQVSLSML